MALDIHKLEDGRAQALLFSIGNQVYLALKLAFKI